ncbi:MAG TPA: hypothetical protein VGM03_04310, partial [Phycisphaerae bacterium]
MRPALNVNAERYEQLERVFEAACQRQGAARAVFLDQACRGDSELRREVDALLTFDKRAEDFIEQ